MPTTRVYYSTDRDAPVLTGQVNKMVDMLYACLVEGFPAITVSSLTRSGTTATVDCAVAHGFKVGQAFSITGATDAAWNGNYTVDTVVDTDTFTYILTTTPTLTSATGTIKAAGEKTVGTATSVTRSGSTVTVNLTGHGFSANQRFRLEGADQSDYNNVWKVATVVDANNFTFDIGTATPATPATGTILIRYGQPGSGWTRPFASGNKAAYRSGGGNQYYYRFDDSSASYGRGYLSGYQTMSDVDTGTNRMASADTVFLFAKSTTTDATARKWVVAATDRFVHVAVVTGENAALYSHFCFGDFKSFNTVATYDSMVMGRSWSNYTAAQIASANYTGDFSTRVDAYGSTTQTSSGAGCIGTTSAFGFKYLGKYMPNLLTSTQPNYYMGNSAQATFPYPAANGNSLYLSPVYLYQLTPGCLRGSIPGMWGPMSDNPGANEDTLSGSGALAGRTFLLLRMANTGTMALEISDTWDD